MRIESHKNLQSILVRGFFFAVVKGGNEKRISAIL